MVYKPVHMEVNQHAIDPNDINKGLDLSGVCSWVREKRGDPRYSGRSSSQPASVSFSSKLELTLDEYATDGGDYRSQDEWIAYFNERKKCMVSMPDLYLAGKSNNQKLLDNLRTDFKRSRVVTSTRIEYVDETNAKIIHNYGSTLIQPVEYKLVIPEYCGQPPAAVLDINTGLNYLQCLFRTNDSALQIENTLQKLSDYPLDKTGVWSAAILDRPTARVPGFIYNGGGFLVCGNYTDSIGRSRGVRLTR